MSFSGEYRHNMDQKNRIFIPAKFRELLGEKFTIARDLREKCLKIYSGSAWEAYMKQLEEMPSKLSDQFLRILSGTSVEVSPDSQGRIVLPKELVAHAQIEREVVIVGCWKNAEIWSEALYKKMNEEVDVEALVEELDRLEFRI